jgi:hypothetical protein
VRSGASKTTMTVSGAMAGAAVTIWLRIQSCWRTIWT